MKGITKTQFEVLDTKLAAVIDELESMISNAEDYKSERSDNWAESDAGSSYEEKIDQLNEFRDTADELRDEISNFSQE